MTVGLYTDVGRPGGGCAEGSGRVNNYLTAALAWVDRQDSGKSETAAASCPAVNL